MSERGCSCTARVFTNCGCPVHDPVGDRVRVAHQVLGALIHTAVANDDQSSPEGFAMARDLGLLDHGNPRTTPAGRAVLRMLGVLPDA